MARQARRGIALIDRKTVLVQDEVETAKPSDVWWFMTVPTASHGPRQTPRLPKRRASASNWARIPSAGDAGQGQGSPVGAHRRAARTRSSKFWTPSRFPLPPTPASRMPTRGVRKLAIHLPGVTSLRLAVEMVPLQEGEDPPAQAAKRQTAGGMVTRFRGYDVRVAASGADRSRDRFGTRRIDVRISIELQ